MVNSKNACELIRKLPDVSEKDHFGGDAFSANKRMFATVWHDKKVINVRLSPQQQNQFLETDCEAFAEINNAWGKQGWTRIELQYINKKLLESALQAAWEFSAVKGTKKKPIKEKRK